MQLFQRAICLSTSVTHLGTIYQDEMFADVFPGRGQPAYTPWRLALVTVFQFIENLTDRQAADAVRSRLDWKYCLSLELTDAGFDHRVLSEFRTRLVALTAEERFLEAVVELCKERGWLKPRGKQRTDSTHVLAKIRALNRAECVIETLCHALNVLAVVAPDWLRGQIQPEWLDRYEHRAEEYRLPKGEEKRQQLLHQVGQDGWGLLAAIQADQEQCWMLSIPTVDTLQRVWKQDYLSSEQGGTWIPDEDWLPSAKLFYSPYDLDASAATKRSTHWIGYKVHFSETCDEEASPVDYSGDDHHCPHPRSARPSRGSRGVRATSIAPQAASRGRWIRRCRGAREKPDQLPDRFSGTNCQRLSMASKGAPSPISRLIGNTSKLAVSLTHFCGQDQWVSQIISSSNCEGLRYPKDE